VSFEQRQATRGSTRLLHAPQRLAPEVVGHYVNRCTSALLIGASGIGGQYQVGYCDHQWGLAGSTGTVVGLVVKHDHTPTGTHMKTIYQKAFLQQFREGGNSVPIEKR
jgi:hypothetical protein